MSGSEAGNDRSTGERGVRAVVQPLGRQDRNVEWGREYRPVGRRAEAAHGRRSAVRSWGDSFGQAKECVRLVAGGAVERARDATAAAEELGMRSAGVEGPGRGHCSAVHTSEPVGRSHTLLRGAGGSRHDQDLLLLVPLVHGRLAVMVAGRAGCRSHRHPDRCWGLRAEGPGAAARNCTPFDRRSPRGSGWMLAGR